MKAMILAAGLGTRLRPLTDHRPKALVEVAGGTLLQITLSRLRAFGVREVIINAHHFADMVVDYLKSHHDFGMRIEISREETLLDTGGGLKKAAGFFLEGSGGSAEPFVVHNVDVVSAIDLRRMAQWHTENQALATLAVQHRETSRYLLFDQQFQLCGWQAAHAAPNVRDARVGVEAPGSPTPGSPTHPGFACGGVEARPGSGRGGVGALAFAGIHVISPRLFGLMTEQGAFSIIDCYLRLAAQGERIIGFPADEYEWHDFGKLENVTIG